MKLYVELTENGKFHQAEFNSYDDFHRAFFCDADIDYKLIVKNGKVLLNNWRRI